MRAPATPAAVGGVPLTEGQRARMGRLIFVIWNCDPRQTGAGIVAYAEQCFLTTVRRVDGAFEDRGRIQVGGRAVMVV